ncbi:Dabb family protein [Actinomadura sp. HBU206391]|uniref:Dabb family protein n=1 Tax=Actinomadura sp. HBU206391 TaxID=2731692 RepID=UPI0016509253|nr:Dabb family protein [Actinomadura sp. HBU206391]MBC6461228.1 Dabb family protein [Actinomadura sp. HBU206391]
MLRHVVLFTWTEGTTDEQLETLTTRLAELPGLIPEIKSFTFGSDARINEGNHDFGIVAEFADQESFVVYRDHPSHRAVIAECIAPIRDQRAALQFEVG